MLMKRKSVVSVMMAFERSQHSTEVPRMMAESQPIFSL